MVSIVVPVHNAEQYIRQTVDSVLHQTYTDWELILVDDVSTDHSVDVIRKIISENPGKRILLFCQSKNLGAAAARNRGVEEARGRYLAYLDADDLWLEDKLEKQLQFIQKHEAAFTFTAYEFGSAKAVPTGKITRVPRTLNYKEALSRTVIFTSTVMIDTQKLGKPMMPEVPSEDTATWWEILRKGTIAYGLNQPLAIYRRPANSLSSDKKVAVRRIWNLYRNQEGLGRIQSAWLLLLWSIRAVVRRMMDDVVRTHLEAIRRFTVLQLGFLGLVLHTAIYAVFWFRILYPELELVRYNRKGENLGVGLHLYFRGHLLILLIYFSILLFLSNSSGSSRMGYLKPWNAFSSQITSLAVGNILTYFQLSVMKNWLLPGWPFLAMTGIQFVIAGIWAFLSDVIYRNVFPPRETLVVNLGGVDAKETIERFLTRQDKFQVTKLMESESMQAIEKECLRWYDCVVICGGEAGQRRELIEYCYQRFIRIYLIPYIGDLLIQGTEQMDLFDTPILQLKEYTIRWEVRLIKNVGEFLLCLIPALVSLLFVPFHGKMKQERCLGRNRKEFTKYGLGFWNVLNGTMALVGPEAKEVTRAREELQKDKRASYRYRIKPGIIGLTQLYRSADTSEEDQLKMDIYYILHYSLHTDIKLLLQSLRQLSK